MTPSRAAKAKRQQSNAWFERAKKVTPGGVSSPVRAFGSVGGTPLVIRSAAGALITDSDGREYLDFVGSWGPLIFGHAHPKIVAAVEAARVPVEAEVPVQLLDEQPRAGAHRHPVDEILHGGHGARVEVAEQLGWRVPDVVIYPTGGGEGTIGIWRALCDMRSWGWLPTDTTMPRMIVAQAAGCAPIHRAHVQAADRAEPLHGEHRENGGDQGRPDHRQPPGRHHFRPRRPYGVCQCAEGDGEAEEKEQTGYRHGGKLHHEGQGSVRAFLAVQRTTCVPLQARLCPT